MKHLNKAPGSGEANFGDQNHEEETILSPELQTQYDNAVAQLVTLKEQILSGKVDLKKVKKGQPFVMDLGQFDLALQEALFQSVEFRALRHRSVLGLGSGLIPTLRPVGNDENLSLQFQIITADDKIKPDLDNLGYPKGTKKVPFPKDKLKLPDEPPLKPPEGGLL